MTKTTTNTAKHVSRTGLLMLGALLTITASCTVAEARTPAGGYVMPQLPYGLQIDLLDEYGRAFPTAYRSGRRYVLGEAGRRYTIRVTNPSGRRVEVVASVDGLDVVDGKVASLTKRGYIVNPGSEVRIEGWRTSYHTIAAFRFGSVADSYAGRTSGARNVGVIGVALFAEREVPQAMIPVPMPSPRDDGYYGGGPRAERGGAAGAAPAAPPPPAAKSAAPAPTGRAQASAEAAPRSRMGGGGEGMVARRAPVERPGLGTEYGERMGSSVRMVTFERESARPLAFAELRYNDRSGLARLGIHFGPYYGNDTVTRETANPFPGDRFASPPPPSTY